MLSQTLSTTCWGFCTKKMKSRSICRRLSVFTSFRSLWADSIRSLTSSTKGWRVMSLKPLSRNYWWGKQCNWENTMKVKWKNSQKSSEWCATNSTKKNASRASFIPLSWPLNPKTCTTSGWGKWGPCWNFFLFKRMVKNEKEPFTKCFCHWKRFDDTLFLWMQVITILIIQILWYFLDAISA